MHSKQKLSMKLKLIFILLFLANNVQSQTFDNSLTEKLDQLLAQYVQGVSPGLAVGIVKNGEVVYENYLGYADLEHNVKIDTSTRFNIASTAKQFTALMILQLSLEGKLSLEDDIRKYIPSLYSKLEDEIKIRHLLNHTSGIRDYVFLLEMKSKPFWKQVGMDNDDVIELLEKQEELVFKPGSKYSYSNSGYTILSEIIEKVSGKKFNAYSNEFFEELGMNKTSFVKGYMRLIPNRANPYSDWGNGVWLKDLMVTKCNGDGFLYTTLKDQLTYERAIQNAIENKNSLLIKSQQAIPNSEMNTYGFGLELDGRLGRTAQYHSGSTFGYHSHTTRFPNEKLSIFVMSNKGSIWSGNIADEIAAALLPEIVEKAKYDSRMYESSGEFEQGKILGQYVSPDEDLIRIVQEGGKLQWRYANYNPYEIRKEDKNLFAFDYNSDLKIKFYPNELVRFYPTGEMKTYIKLPDLTATIADIKNLIGEYSSDELEMSFKLWLTENDKLKIQFSNRKREREVQVLNRNELLASNFVLKVQRDELDKVTGILVTLNDRAANNRFRLVR